ncbi:acylneuraminate cytidylyltransferase family protein [Candidatus Peribacteria bacterium]|nr:acylneuraminate cytidylyltransferase family protein [Candidatus Peribacteria bacterium]
MNILAIIPARGGSKRFPGKNVVHFNGVPLVGLTAEIASKSGVFQSVCVSSDSEEILTVAQQYGANYVHHRSDMLAGDTVQLSDVCINILNDAASQGQTFDAFAILTPMNPLRSVEDIQSAKELLVETGADGVISLARHTHSPQRALAIRHNRIEQYFPSEELETYKTEEPLYYHDAAIVLMRTAPFLDTGKLYGSNVVPYFTPSSRSVNIDYPIDLEWAKFLFSQTHPQ